MSQGVSILYEVNWFCNETDTLEALPAKPVSILYEVNWFCNCGIWAGSMHVPCFNPLRG